ncbi:TPA_asm: protein 2 [Brassica rapa virus 1]|uniref:Protein 2 n=1 Tax=Brassica rapa virus 1 TaxID=2793725 RepID=A0A8D9PGU1_9RHAB|nr:protein 2 [Brassica rapa virus 1]DAF42358.1 TPA_asm: protein 2 [Brassica rapa virus 1]
MPPRKSKATATRSQISTRSQTVSNESRTQDLETAGDTDVLDVTSPETVNPRTEDPKKVDKTLDKISKLGLNDLANEGEGESEDHGKSSEEAKSEESQHKNKERALVVKPNIPKPVKGSQLRKDAQSSAKKLKAGLEEEARIQRKSKEAQFSQEQLQKMRIENTFLENLQAVMTGTGEPASEIELNDALLLFRDNPEVDIGYFVFYIRGIRKGVSKMNSRIDSDLKEICERLNGTHRMYQATHRSLEKTCLEMSSAIFGTGQTSKQKPVIIQQPKSEKIYLPSSSAVEPRLKRKESPSPPILDVKKPKKSESKAVPLSSLSSAKEKSEPKLILETASDYANAMRTTLARIENSIRDKAEILDFFEAAKTFQKEEWEKAYKEFDKEFIQSVMDKTKKLGMERAKKEKNKKAQV